MKLREDTKWLSKLVGCKLISLEEAKEMSSLNLMKIPNPYAYPEFSDRIKSQPTYGEKFHLIFEQFPLYEMVFFLSNPDGEDGYYCKLKVIDKETIEFGFTDNPLYWITCGIEDQGEAGLGFYDVDIHFDKSKQYRNIAEIKQKIMDLHFVNVRNNIVKPHMILSVLQFFTMFNDQKDRYPISVSKNGKRKFNSNREGEIGKVAGPRIVYLDKLPEPTDKVLDSDIPGSTKAPHQRRGSWCTLRAERYKNHPLYQVEKAIYRKPAWIGDRTRIVHGATYTVIDKQVNLED